MSELDLSVGILGPSCSDPFLFASFVPFPSSLSRGAELWELELLWQRARVTSEKVGEVPGLLASVLVEKYDERARVGTSDSAQIPARARGS